MLLPPIELSLSKGFTPFISRALNSCKEEKIDRANQPVTMHVCLAMGRLAAIAALAAYHSPLTHTSVCINYRNEKTEIHLNSIHKSENGHVRIISIFIRN